MHILEVQDPCPYRWQTLYDFHGGPGSMLEQRNCEKLYAAQTSHGAIMVGTTPN